MTTQAPRSVQPGHISEVPAIERRNHLGQITHFDVEPHGMCECDEPLDVSGWGECQRCHRPVP